MRGSGTLDVGVVRRLVDVLGEVAATASSWYQVT